MIHLAGERGWAFKFGDESVPVEAVFNHSTYAPALLAAAETELAARRIGGTWLSPWRARAIPCLAHGSVWSASGTHFSASSGEWPPRR